MKDTVLTGLHTWSVFQPDRRIDFNGVFWRREAGNVLIDPMPLTVEGERFIAAHGGVSLVLVSNADHFRAAGEIATRYGATIAAPAGDRERFGARAAAVGCWFESAAGLPAGLEDDLEVHWLRGGKSAVEAAFYLRPLRALFFADAVRSHVSGVLRLLPEDKLSDAARLCADLRALRDLNLAAILLGDGDCLFTGARSAFLEFLRNLDVVR